MDATQVVRTPLLPVSIAKFREPAETERRRARPALLSGLEPPIHLKLCRLGIKILHRVAPELWTEYPIEPVRDRYIETWSHLVSAPKEGLPRSHDVRLIKISLIVDRSRDCADSEFLEHTSSACTEKGSPSIPDRIRKLDVHHQRDLQEISFCIQLHRSIEIRITTDSCESPISCDGVRFDCVVDTASFELEIDPLVQAVTWGKIETKTWVETDRLVTCLLYTSPSPRD